MLGRGQTHLTLEEEKPRGSLGLPQLARLILVLTMLTARDIHQAILHNNTMKKGDSIFKNIAKSTKIIVVFVLFMAAVLDT